MKKIKLVFMLFLSLFLLSFLSSCNLNWYFNPNGNSQKVNDFKLEYDFKESDMIIIRSKMEDLDYETDNPTSTYNFVSLVNYVFSKFYEIQSYYTISNIRYCINKTSDNLIEKKNMYSYFIEVRKYILDYYTKVYNSDYRDHFYNGWTEDDIQDALDAKESDELTQLRLSQEEIEDEMGALSDTELVNSGFSKYIEYLELNNEIASKKGFNNYIEYMYDSYGRKYTESDAQNIYNYAKNELSSSFYDIYQEYKKVLNSLSTSERSLFQNLLKDSGTSVSRNRALNYFNGYKEYMGGTFKSTWDDMIGNNYFQYYKDETSQDGAFTAFLYHYKSPIIYIGYGYFTSLTLSHEFGHYYAMNNNKSSTSDLDLAETHSQSDEILFVSYLDKENILGNEKIEKLVKLYEILDALESVFIATIVSQFELYTYKLTSYENVDFDQKIEEIAEDLLGDMYSILNINFRRYWRKVEFGSSIYYISYAVSAIPSIALYNDSKSDFDLAKSKYLTLCEYEEDFNEALEEAEFNSPFNVQTYSLIKSNIQELISEAEAI